MRDAGEHRLLAVAVLASIVLHALLFFAFPGLRDARETLVVPGPVTARLVEPVPAASPPKLEELPQAAKPVPRATPAAKAAPAKQESPRAETVFAAPARKTPASAQASETTAAPAAPASAAQPEAKPAASAPAAVEAGTVAQYRIALMDAMRPDDSYPRIALDNNWQGRVDIRIVIGPGGAIASLAVRSSAGHDALDRHALAMIRKAQPKTPIPAVLRGREFKFEVPVIFSLNDEERR